MNQLHGGADWMRAATQIAQAIEPLDGQRQAGEQPDDQQAVGVMMTHMPQTMAVLGIIKSLVFDFPTALGAKIEHPTADFFLKRIREPEGFDRLTVWFLLPIEQDPHGFPTQTLPGIEVFGIPKFDAILAVRKGQFGRLASEALLRRGQQLRQVGFQARHHRQAQITSDMEKRTVANSPSTTTYAAKRTPSCSTARRSSVNAK